MKSAGSRPHLPADDGAEAAGEEDYEPSMAPPTIDADEDVDHVIDKIQVYCQDHWN